LGNWQSNAKKHSEGERKQMKTKMALFVILLAALFVALPVQARMDLQKELPFKAHVLYLGSPFPQAPPPWYQTVSGSGVCTHMGLITLSQHHMVVPAADGGIDFYDGVFVWTAANGDIVTGTYSGHMPPNPAGYLDIQGYWFITGGTGRFQHAIGEGPASGIQYFNGVGDMYCVGWIEY
jgi:hypothetical protein